MSRTQSLASQLQALVTKVAELEANKSDAAAEIRKLRRDVAILWEVAYEGLEPGKAFYDLVTRMTGFKHPKNKLITTSTMKGQ